MCCDAETTVGRPSSAAPGCISWASILPPSACTASARRWYPGTIDSSRFTSIHRGSHKLDGPTGVAPVICIANPLRARAPW